MSPSLKTQSTKLLQNIINKVTKKVKFITKTKNTTKLLILISILIGLYIIHSKYIQEGMAVKAEKFEQQIADTNGKALVLFHAPWCGHCKKLMPDWNAATKDVKDKKGVSMIKVDCGSPQENKTHAKIMEKYGIQGYPTIKVFENGKVTGEYEGNRNKAGLLSSLGM